MKPNVVYPGHYLKRDFLQLAIGITAIAIFMIWSLCK